MSKPDLSQTDGMLQEWGARLFHPPLKGKQTKDDGALAHAMLVGQALSPGVKPNIRAQIRANIAPSGKQVLVKISGGGRGMKAMQAHMRYISRLGKDEAGGKGQSHELEDENGNQIAGAQALKDLAQDWRLAGSYIDDDSPRREAFNIVLSMPEGTPPEAVREAAREFAKATFEGHKWVMVLHTDTRSPHVHLAVRAERSDGRRLNPRKADLQRWREAFAARLQDRGINALATKARVRGVERSSQGLWRIKAAQRVREPKNPVRQGERHANTMAQALHAWREIEAALKRSPEAADRALARDVQRYVNQSFAAASRDRGRSAQHGRRTNRDER